MSVLRTTLSAVLVVSLVQSVAFGVPVSKPAESSRVIRAANDVPYRLPGESQPISYTITITPHIIENEFSFNGESLITINVLKETSTLTLHAHQNLTIHEDIKLISSSTIYNATNRAIEPRNDFLKITFKDLIPKGIYGLQLKFSGVINEELRGFYRSSYTDRFGKQTWMASTQFEPIGARLAFPCYDEPALKATFSLSIKHSEQYTVLSNTPIANTTIDFSDLTLKTTRFLQTPRMSTYLVAWVLADFDVIRSDDLKFKVWARKDAIQHGKYALEIGEKELEALGNYTNIKYKTLGIDKMESIALPALSAGAMENWGLVTYQENGLLVNENVTSTADIEGVATVIAHEFAHQWFGNSVTPEWWEYIWLNEGFANYFQYVITDQVEPTWRLMERFVVQNLQATAFVADSEISSHAMNVKVETAEQIKNVFDKISYSKAGSVIRMISHVLGQEKFKLGLRRYLENNKNKVVNSDALFEALNSSISDVKSFKGIFKNWVTTPGFPVVSVTRDYKSEIANISQSRFLYEHDDNRTSEKYWVPINYILEGISDFNDTKPTDWLSPDVNVTQITNITKDKFVIFNIQQFGYYRVNYDENNWKLITNFLNKKSFTHIHVVNRAQLIDDSLNLARIGQLNYNVALALIGYLKQETDYIPWAAAWNGISYIDKVLANTELSKPFRNYVLELSDKLVKEVTFIESAKDDHITKLKRISALTWACTLGSKACRDDASQRLTKWLANSKENALSSDLKSLTICAGVRNADQKTWNKIFDKYLSEKDADLLTALGCTSDAAILKAYLTHAINKTSGIEDSSAVFKAVYTGSDGGVDVALDFIIANLNATISLNKNDTSVIVTYVTKIGDRITTKKQFEKLKKFIENNKATLPTDISNGLKNAEVNLNWHDARAKEVQLFLKKDSPKPNTGSTVTFTVSITLALIVSFVIPQM